MDRKFGWDVWINVGGNYQRILTSRIYRFDHQFRKRPFHWKARGWVRVINGGWKRAGQGLGIFQKSLGWRHVNSRKLLKMSFKRKFQWDNMAVGGGVLFFFLWRLTTFCFASMCTLDAFEILTWCTMWIRLSKTLQKEKLFVNLEYLFSFALSIWWKALSKVFAKW